MIAYANGQPTVLKRSLQALKPNVSSVRLSWIQAKATAIYSFQCETRLYLGILSSDVSLRLSKTKGGLPSAKLEPTLSRILLPLLQTNCIEVEVAAPEEKLSTLDDFNIEIQISLCPEVFQFTANASNSASQRQSLLELFTRFQEYITKPSLKFTFDQEMSKDLHTAAPINDFEHIPTQVPVRKHCSTLPLLDFQEWGVSWMAEREVKSSDLPYDWEEYSFPAQPVVYLNSTMGQISLKCPSNSNSCRGGILADEKGLDKKIQILGLIRSQVLKIASTGPKKMKAEYGGTLIITTLPALKSWVRKCRQFLPESGIVKYSRKYNKTLRELRGANVVITTFGQLHYDSTHKIGLLGVFWFRVVIDKGACIGSVNSITSQACISLQCHYKWILTSSLDFLENVDLLYAFISILKIEPWSSVEWWNKLLALKTVQPASILDSILKTFIICRTKNTLDSAGYPLVQLPSMKMTVETVQLTSEELDIYTCIFEKIISKITNTQVSDYVVWKSLQKLRRACLFLKLRTESTDQAMLDLLAWVRVKHENIDKLAQKLLQDLDCPLCLTTADRALLTKCGHIFCKCCLKSQVLWLRACPICNESLYRSSTIQIPKLSYELVVSSKLSKVLVLLQEPMETVVISQWMGLLEALSDLLSSKNIESLELNGTMSHSTKVEQLELYKTTKLLLSTPEITQFRQIFARRVVFCEPWLELSVQRKVLRSVERIGSTHEISIIHLVSEDTIEEAIYASQPISLTSSGLKSLISL